MTNPGPSTLEPPPSLPSIPANSEMDDMVTILFKALGEQHNYNMRLWEWIGTQRSYNFVIQNLLNQIAVTGGDQTIEDLIVTQTSTLQGAVTAESTLNVQGATDLDAALNVDSTIHADGTIDTDASLVVDLVSTLTGVVTLGSHLDLSEENGITASTTQTQAAGYVLSKTISNVTVSGTDGDAVTMPVGAAGRFMFIRNSDAAQTIKVFPGSGGTINGAAPNASITLAAGESGFFFDVGGNIWVMAIGA